MDLWDVGGWDGVVNYREFLEKITDLLRKVQEEGMLGVLCAWEENVGG